jgi:hyperosmotically inducible protein
MLRLLFRLIFVGALLAGGAYLLGYRWDDAPARVRAAAGGAGAAAGGLVENIEPAEIRAAGAGIAEKVGEGAGRAEAALSAAHLTAKIKAKLTLDDTLDGSRINVDTQGTAVTLRGSVESAAQRQRAVQLAKETEGVTSVIERLAIREP